METPHSSFLSSLLAVVGVVLTGPQQAATSLAQGVTTQRCESIAVMDDITGDGCNEIVIAARPRKGCDSGCVGIYDGRTLTSLLLVNGHPECTAFGTWILPIPDVDSDGLGDLAVGAPGDAHVGAGRIAIISSASGKVLRNLRAASDEVNWSASATVISMHDSSALVTLGQVDGSQASPAATKSVRCSALSLTNTDRTELCTLPPDDVPPDGKLVITAVPDCDEDARPDFAIRTRKGVRIVSTGKKTTIRDISIAGASASCGQTLVSIAASSKETRNMLIVADRGVQDARPLESAINLVDLATGQLSWSAGSKCAEFGRGIAVVEDVDGDQYPDMIASTYFPFCDDLRVLSGKTGVPVRVIDRSSLVIGSAPPEFGWHVQGGGVFGSAKKPGVIASCYSSKSPDSKIQQVCIVGVDGELLGRIRCGPYAEDGK